MLDVSIMFALVEATVIVVVSTAWDVEETEEVVVDTPLDVEVDIVPVDDV